MTKKERKKYLDRQDISIEGNVATWRIATSGEINGTYIGTFQFKCFLTPSEKLAAGRLYRELLGPSMALAYKTEDDLAYLVSQLKYRIVSAPPFWNSSIGVNEMTGDIPDEGVIGQIFDAATNAELKYRAMIEEKTEQDLQRAKLAAEAVYNQKMSRPAAEDAPKEETGE